MTEKILLTDDDPNILSAFRRRLRRQFQLETALGGQEGLKILEDRGPFAVIVSDMRMPDMDGIQLLTRVKERAPDTVRMMLTGNADLQTAIEAVNEGSIFRFLTKPCPPETFARALRAGLEQYHLIVAEQELLEKTLSGSIKLLTEMLSLISPTAFSQASRVRRYVRHIATRLGLADAWQFEVAAMLSQIGCVSVPPRILDKIHTGRSLSSDEQGIFSAHPAVGARLLANIPRLETIAQMIEGQGRSFMDHVPRENPTSEDTTGMLGAQILKVTMAFDRMATSGLPYGTVIRKLRERQDTYNPYLVDALETLQMDDAQENVREVSVRDLFTNTAEAEGVDRSLDTFEAAIADQAPDTFEAAVEDQAQAEVGDPAPSTVAVEVKDLSLNTVAVADEDIVAENGVILVSKGQELTYPVLVRLRSFSLETGVREPFRVRIVDQDR